MFVAQRATLMPCLTAPTSRVGHHQHRAQPPGRSPRNSKQSARCPCRGGCAGGARPLSAGVLETWGTSP
jgi:hypothetical protein